MNSPQPKFAVGDMVKLYGDYGKVEALSTSVATGIVIVTVAIDGRIRLRVPESEVSLARTR